MQISNVTNSIISTLGNPDSRIPLAIKDVINSTGITYFSYDAGGKLEGKDRFIDEFGTEIIWLAGLPFYKTIADKTIYKLRKLNPNIDIRVINSKEHYEFAKKILSDAPPKEEKKLLDSLKEAKTRFPEFKKLFYAKFGLATILTFASYYALTVYKQKVTEKSITKEYIKKKIENEYFVKRSQESNKFKEFDNVTFSGIKNNKPSFKGALDAFMFNPLKNMLLVDAGITTERLTKSRNKHEFMEYAIKEGSLLFLLYVAGKWIKSGLDGFSEKVLKLPIDLDLRFLNSAIFKNAICQPNLENQIKEFKSLKTTGEILKYLDEKQFAEGETIIKGAKISGIIGQFKSENINPLQYIDVDELKGYVDSIDKFIKAKNSSNLTNLDFLQKAKNVKIASVIANIGICCFTLGYLVPKIMFQYRKQKAGTKEFHVEKQIIEKLEQSFSGNKI